MQKARHSGINGFPAISADSSLVHVQGKLNACYKDNPVQGNVQSSALSHFDRFLALVSWRGMAQGEKIRTLRDQRIPGHFG